MMAKELPRSTAGLWGRFCFSVVGSLLSSPPARGELKVAIQSLAAKTWTHPVSGHSVRFAAVAIERWYYTARREKDDPVPVLQRAVRKDTGEVCMDPALSKHLFHQYHDHQDWSYQLHCNNLTVLVKADSNCDARSLAPDVAVSHFLVREIARKGRLLGAKAD
jgi:hypothetical protein